MIKHLVSSCFSSLIRSAKGSPGPQNGPHKPHQSRQSSKNSGNSYRARLSPEQLSSARRNNKKTHVHSWIPCICCLAVFYPSLMAKDSSAKLLIKSVCPMVHDSEDLLFRGCLMVKTTHFLVLQSLAIR